LFIIVSPLVEDDDELLELVDALGNTGMRALKRSSKAFQ